MLRTNMKKFLTLYSIAAFLMLSFASCLESDDPFEVELTPYATLRSFAICDINTKTIVKTDDGRDSTVVKITPGVSYPFAIDQENNLAYNVDSLPVGTDITRVAVEMKCDGAAYVYADSIDEYRLFMANDSIDFTKPMRLLITSTDGTYAREYKVSLNVHTTDPNQLYWRKCSATPVASMAECRVLEKGDSLYLFSAAEDGVASLHVAALPDASAWAGKALNGLPAAANFNSITLYEDNFYVVADGVLYTSVDGALWNEVAGNGGIKTLFAASDDDYALWAVVNDSLAYCSNVADGFTMVQALPSEFPLYGISSSVNVLRTNYNISRYVVVGYPSMDAQARPQVWSKLTSENMWSHYEPSSYNEKQCPALESLAVIDYDSRLYAFGGKGVVNGVDVAPFAAIYVSRDNGITWDSEVHDAPMLPSELVGVDAPFATTVGAGENIWLVVGGGNVWCGRMNKFEL